MNPTTLVTGALVLVVTLAGCASAPSISPEQIQQQFPAIARLDQALESARQRDLDILAPEGMAAASARARSAASEARAGRAAQAGRAAETGLAQLEEAERDARASADVLSEVLAVRKRALAAGAGDLFAADLDDLDDDLRGAARRVERGDLEAAKQSRPELRKSYAALELRALKESTIQRARQAIDQARENGANGLAPKTLANAEESLKVAVSVLEADRTARARADASAEQASLQARRSEEVAEIVRDHDRRDFTPEDIVLWYQDQLSEVVAPLGQELHFTDSNEKTVADLRGEVATLVDERRQLIQARAEIDRLKATHAREIADLKARFAGEQSQLSVAQQEREERFAFIQQLFKDDEATVYRQVDNVLISVHGFQFPTGSSEIRPQNFGVMNKIIESVRAFRNPKIRIAGHTDATGSDNLNLDLSAQRAASVARFLTDVGRIPANTITATGHGSQRPVATNATPEGRAKNRRIEVLIVNN